MTNYFSRIWWEDNFKYSPLAQKIFLWLNLSSHFPATLNIEPTNLCNLSCSFCPVKKSGRIKGFMDLGLFEKIIDQIKGKKIKVLWLNKDGEPLMHPQIDQMIKKAKEKKVAERIEIYTNGLLLSEKMAERLIKAGLDSLVVSLDAVDRKSYKKLKNKDVYEPVVDQVLKFFQIRRQLKAKKPLLSVKMVNFGNQSEVEKFKKTWEGVADRVVIQPLHTWEGSITMSKVTSRRDSPKGTCQKSKVKKRYPCNLPWLAPAVTWDGKIVACCVNYQNNELVMGDLTKEYLATIWQGQQFKNLRLAHLKQDFSSFPTCPRCQFWQQLPNMDWRLKK